jgi:hypothetical protein
MESNIDTALAGDTKSISMLRSLKLYFERMGADQQVRSSTRGPAVLRHVRIAAPECVLLADWQQHCCRAAHSSNRLSRQAGMHCSNLQLL